MWTNCGHIAAMVRWSPGGGEINPRSWPTEWNAEKQTYKYIKMITTGSKFQKSKIIKHLNFQNRDISSQCQRFPLVTWWNETWEWWEGMEHRGTHLKQLKRSKPSCCGKSGDIFTNWISFRSFSRLSTEARNFSFKSIFSLNAQIISLRMMCLITVPNPRAFVKICSRYVQAISLQLQTSEQVHHVAR